MNLTRHRTFIGLILAMFLLSSCSLQGPSVATQDVNAIYTAAAQTLQAQLTQSAAQQPPTQPPTDTPLPTDTPMATELVPTDTPAPIFTATTAFTPTSAAPVVVATTNANCRPGPAPEYTPIVTVLRNGDRAEIFGRNSGKSWWYVQIPGKAGQYCWVWANNVNVEGDTGGVQVVAAPPIPRTATPTPSPAKFEADFDNIHDCSGNPYAIFELNNEGDVAFESMRLVIDDVDADKEIFDDDSNAPFMGAGGECPPGGDTFPKGKTFFVGGNIEDGKDGNDATAKITLCTEDDLDGSCVTEEVDFEIEFP